MVVPRCSLQFLVPPLTWSLRASDPPIVPRHIFDSDSIIVYEPDEYYTMSGFDDLARAAQVEHFAADLAVSSVPLSSDETPDLEQLRSDFVEYQKAKSAQTYAKINEIENRLLGTRFLPIHLISRLHVCCRKLKLTMYFQGG